MILYSENDKRKIIMDYYLNSRRRIQESKLGFKTIYSHSSTCVDEITLYYNNDYSEFYFQAKGCAIFLSSCEIFIERLLELGFEHKDDLINNYQNLINKKNLDDKQKQMIGKLLIYENVAKHLNRKECALMISQLFEKI